MKRSHQKLSQSLAILFGAVPFAFALVRAVRTGDDFRYSVGRSRVTAGCNDGLAIGKARRTRASVGLGFTAFVLATLFATAAALFLGTQFGPGVLVVGSGFGGCLAASSVLYALGGQTKLGG